MIFIEFNLFCFLQYELNWQKGSFISRIIRKTYYLLVILNAIRNLLIFKAYMSILVDLAQIYNRLLKLQHLFFLNFSKKIVFLNYFL